MHLVLGISTVNGIVGWVLVAAGGLAILLAVAASSIEAFRKAFQSSGIQSFAASETKPWSKILDLFGEILKELLGKTGGPTFVMGLILVGLGILVLNEKLL